MGNPAGMGQKHHTVTLYSSQRDIVSDIIQNEGVYYAKRRFIQEKYGEVAPVFFGAYDWYLPQASKLVPKPQEAEAAVWAFCSAGDVSRFPDAKILKLEVPVGEAVFFDQRDWERILNFSYLGTERECGAFDQKLVQNGVSDPKDIVLSPFYPLLKRELQTSWLNLFRHHESVKNGRPVPVLHIQAGLWRIRKEWVAAVI